MEYPPLTKLEIVRASDVIRALGVSPFLFKKILKEDPTFPKPIKMPGKPKWKKSDIEDYIKSR